MTEHITHKHIYDQLKPIFEGCDTILDALHFGNMYIEKYPHMKSMIISYMNGINYRDHIDIKTKQSMMNDVNMCNNRDDALEALAKLTNKTTDDVYRKTLERIAHRKNYGDTYNAHYRKQNHKYINFRHIDNHQRNDSQNNDGQNNDGRNNDGQNSDGQNSDSPNNDGQNSDSQNNDNRYNDANYRNGNQNNQYNISKKCPHCFHILNMPATTQYVICGYHNSTYGYDWNGCGRDWCFHCNKMLCKRWETNNLHLQMNRHHDDECCLIHAQENNYKYPDDYCQ